MATLASYRDGIKCGGTGRCGNDVHNAQALVVPRRGLRRLPLRKTVYRVLQLQAMLSVFFIATQCASFSRRVEDN